MSLINKIAKNKKNPIFLRLYTKSTKLSPIKKISLYYYDIQT